MTLVKWKAPDACSLHCMIHSQALASKTLPQALLETLDTVIRTVNFVKTSVLNSRLLKKQCLDMDSVHETLLFYTQVHLLSKGNVFALREGIKLFLCIQNKLDQLSAWTEDLTVYKLVNRLKPKTTDQQNC